MHFFNNYTEALGWALLHFLWQGTVVALLLGLFLRALRQRTAQVRYALAGLGLLLMLGAFLGTLVVIWERPEVVVVSENRPHETYRNNGADTTYQEPAVQPTVMPEAAPLVISQPPPVAATPLAEAAPLPAPVPVPFSEKVRPYLPWAVGVWAVGVVCFALRFLFALLAVRGWKRSGQDTVSTEWKQRFSQLRAALEVSRPVQFLYSAAIAVPMVIGWLKPVVLVPAGLFTGLTTAQLEAILAHELAHIRRHDYLANLFQHFMETLFFYHPAVWWVSDRMREEREHCCDDLAAIACGGALGYAKALTALEELRGVAPVLSVSASGGSLLARIRRILGLPEEKSRSWPLGLLAVLALAIIPFALAKEEGRPAPLEEEKATKGSGTLPLLERGGGILPPSPDASPAAPAPNLSEAQQSDPHRTDAPRTLVGSADGALDQSWLVTNGPGEIKLNSSVTLLPHQENAAAKLPDNMATIRWYDEAGTEVGKRDVVLPRGKQFPPIIYQKGGDAFWFEEAVLGAWQNAGEGQLGVRKVGVVSKMDQLKFWPIFRHNMWIGIPSFDGMAGAGQSYLMRNRNVHPAKALHLHFEDTEAWSSLQKSDVISVTALPIKDQISAVEVTLSDTGMARLKLFGAETLKAEWNNLKNYRLNVTNLSKFRIDADLTATEAEVLAAWLQSDINRDEVTREGFPEVRFKASAGDRHFAGASDLEIREAGSYWVDSHLKAIVTSVAADGTIRNELEYRSIAPDGSMRTGKSALPDGEGTWSVLLRPHVKGIPWLSVVLTEAGMDSRAYFEDRGFDDDYVFPHISAEQLSSGEAKFPDAPQVITWATIALKQLKSKVGAETTQNLDGGTGVPPVSPSASSTEPNPDPTKGQPNPNTNISPDPASAPARGQNAPATASLADAQYLEACALAADGEKLLEAKDNTAAYYKFKDAAKLLDTLGKNHPNMRAAEVISTREKLKQLTENALRGEIVKRRPMMKIRGVNLGDLPGQPDASKFPEVLEPYPGKPEIFRARKDVFSVVLGDRSPSIYYTSIYYKAGSDHFYLKVWNYPLPDLYYGPIPGHPSRLGLAAWMREPTQVKSPDKMLFVASEMMKSGDETLAEIALGWLDEVQQGTPRSYERAVDEVKTWLATHPDSQFAATCRETLTKLTSTADRVAGEWDKARPILPDDRYQAGELVAADIPKVAWGKANSVGLRLGVTQLETTPAYKFGEDIKLASIYLRNEGPNPIKFSYSLAPGNNFYAQIHGPMEEISYTGIIMDPAKGQHGRLEPGRAIILSASYQLTILAESEREKKKAFIPARTTTPSKPLPTNPIYVNAAGECKLRLICNLSSYDVLDESGEMHPTPAGEWVGRLAAADIPIKILEQDAGSLSPLERGAGLQPASPGASSAESAPEPTKGQSPPNADISPDPASAKASGLQARATWSATGRVTDAEGHPMPDVDIWVATGMGSLKSQGPVKTDADGRYRAEFLPGFATTKDAPGLQFANITARKSGFTEKNLSRHGAGSMAAREVPVEDLKGYPNGLEGLSLPGKPRQVDFVMVPSVTIKGRLLGNGNFSKLKPSELSEHLRKHRDEPLPKSETVELKHGPLAGWKVWLKGKDLPPGASVIAVVTTDAEGNFEMPDVPPGFEWQFQCETNLMDHKEPMSRLFKADDARGKQVILELDEKQGAIEYNASGAGLQPASPDAEPTKPTPDPTKGQPTPDQNISTDPASAGAGGLQARATPLNINAPSIFVPAVKHVSVEPMAGQKKAADELMRNLIGVPETKPQPYDFEPKVSYGGFYFIDEENTGIASGTGVPLAGRNAFLPPTASDVGKFQRTSVPGLSVEAAGFGADGRDAHATGDFGKDISLWSPSVKPPPSDWLSLGIDSQNISSITIERSEPRAIEPPAIAKIGDFPSPNDPRMGQIHRAMDNAGGVANPGPSPKRPEFISPGKALITASDPADYPTADPFAPPTAPDKLAEARKNGIQIKVMDAEGKPLKAFRVIAGVPSSVSAEFEKAHNVKVANWQSHTLHFGHREGLIWPLDKAYDDMALRVEADGFVPQMVAGLDRKKGGQELSFKLVADQGVSGSVTLPDGKSPASKATVVLAMIRRNFRYIAKEARSDDIGDLADTSTTPREEWEEWEQSRSVSADDAGKFTLPTEIDPTAVVLIYHQDGVLEMPYAKWRENPNVTLQPWGRIHGHVQWGDKVGAGETIDLSVNHGDAYGYPDIISQSDSTTADADGNFTFERVLPGIAQLSIPFKTKDAKGAEFTTYQDGMIIHADVKAQQTEVSMGGVGRLVKGQLTGRNNWDGVTFHFHPTAPHIGFAGDEMMWQAWQDFQKSPKGPVFFRDGLKVNVDGSFAIPGMLPGRYQIFFSKDGEKSHVASSQFTVEVEKPNVKPEAMILPEIHATKEEGRPAPPERGAGLQPAGPGSSPAAPTPDSPKSQPKSNGNVSSDPAHVGARGLEAPATSVAQPMTFAEHCKKVAAGKGVVSSYENGTYKGPRVALDQLKELLGESKTK